jgi:hypothetical protein
VCRKQVFFDDRINGIAWADRDTSTRDIIEREDVVQCNKRRLRGISVSINQLDEPIEGGIGWFASKAMISFRERIAPCANHVAVQTPADVPDS